MASPLLGLALSIPQMAFGVFQYLNAVKQSKGNIRPEYQIDPSYQTNIDLIKSNMGLPQDALQAFYNNASQSAASGINAITATGGSPNLIPNLLQQQNRQFNEVLIQDALTKKQDINSLMMAQTALAEQRDKEFQLNKLDVFKDKAAAISLQKDAGLQNITGGATTSSSLVANNSQANIWDNLLKGLNPNTTDPNAAQAEILKQILMSLMNKPQ